MRFLALLAVLAAVGVGCGDDDGTADPELAGTEWELATLDGEAVEVPGLSWIAFGDDGTVSGSGGCNSFTGSYESDGADLSIGPLAATAMACVDPVVEQQEQGFFSALEATVSASVADGELRLAGDDGEIATLSTVQRPEGVVGTWTATGYNNGDSAVVSVLGGTELTAVFGDDGSVGGSAGCNTFMGGYTVDGDTVAIGPLAQTRRSCAEPDGIMDQELRYLTALESAATWSIRGATLELRTADDAIAVTFGPG